jgi:hypothetical protein
MPSFMVQAQDDWQVKFWFRQAPLLSLHQVESGFMTLADQK